MKKLALCFLALSTLALMFASRPAQAGGRRCITDHWAYRYSRTRPWNGDYAYTPWGVPTALIVPPTAEMQTSFSWGVSQNVMTPIYHQFRRPYPGGMDGAGGRYLPTPLWPSHTDQFGVYYVRGAW